jgi:hypothetical protein
MTRFSGLEEKVMKKSTPSKPLKPVKLAKDTLRRLDLTKAVGGSTYTRRTSGYICC